MGLRAAFLLWDTHFRCACTAGSQGFLPTSPSICWPQGWVRRALFLNSALARFSLRSALCLTSASSSLFTIIQCHRFRPLSLGRLCSFLFAFSPFPDLSLGSFLFSLGSFLFADNDISQLLSPD